MCMKDVLTEVDDLLLVFDSVWSAWSCQFQALLCNSHSEAEVNGHCTLCVHLELVIGLVPLGYKNPFQNLPYSSHSTTFLSVHHLSSMLTDHNNRYGNRDSCCAACVNSTVFGLLGFFSSWSKAFKFTAQFASFCQFFDVIHLFQLVSG